MSFSNYRIIIAILLHCELSLLYFNLREADGSRIPKKSRSLCFSSQISIIFFFSEAADRMQRLEKERRERNRDGGPGPGGPGAGGAGGACANPA